MSPENDRQNPEPEGAGAASHANGAEASSADASPALISIGLTCYNAAGTIQRAIASALAQDWPQLELLIVDDCSSDDSVALIEDAIKDAPHAHLLRHFNNGGPAAARNTILSRAQGEFIAFFDDDDESRPNRLRVQYERILTHEAALTGCCRSARSGHLVACFASGVRRYPNGYELHLRAIGSHPQVPRGEEVADYLLFNGRRDGVYYGAGTPTCALMARRTTFEALGGFDAYMRRVEDVDFAVRLARAGGSFVGCPQELYLQHATEGSDKTPLINLQAELQLVDKHADYLRQKGRYDYACDWFRIRFHHFSRQRMAFVLALARFLMKHPVEGTRHLLRSAPGRLRHEKKMLQMPQ